MAEIIEYFVEGCAYAAYPTEILYAFVITSDGEEIGILKKFPFAGKWGCISGVNCRLNDYHSLPKGLDIIYLSISERKFYNVEEIFDLDLLKNIFNILMNEGKTTIKLIVGMAPEGRVAVWLQNEIYSKLILNTVGKEIPTNRVTSFLPNNVTLDEYCEQYKPKLQQIKNNLREGWMRGFNYRYKLSVDEFYDGEKWKQLEQSEVKPEIRLLRALNYDGTYDKSETLHHRGYQITGYPSCINILISHNKEEYDIYMWLNDEDVLNIFKKFYGVHPETKTDFIIRIDAENKKYELALYRQGLQEPVVIPESAYQLIVFKNKFEDYRSENYNQPQGAWIW